MNGLVVGEREDGNYSLGSMEKHQHRELEGADTGTT